MYYGEYEKRFFASSIAPPQADQSSTNSIRSRRVFKMASPRRFADKIAKLKQNQEAGTRAFEDIMRLPVSRLEVCSVLSPNGRLFAC